MTSASVLATFGPSAARLTGRPLRWEPHKPGDRRGTVHRFMRVIADRVR
jgi:hypothetical protein